MILLSSIILTRRLPFIPGCNSIIPSSPMRVPFLLRTFLPLVCATLACDAFLFQNGLKSVQRPFTLIHAGAVQSETPKAGYVPKWKKKNTIAEELGSIGDVGFENVGLKGSIPVIFKQGNETKTSMAWTGQPIKDVASQAGQFIKYGCGKGDCGTCECMVNGKWIRPCVATVPAMSKGEELIIQLKAMKSKGTSSGTFFSIRSFLMGFWNNLLGMIGFVKFRRAARKNWEERREYEARVLQRTLEIKMQRAAAKLKHA